MAALVRPIPKSATSRKQLKPRWKNGGEVVNPHEENAERLARRRKMKSILESNGPEEETPPEK